MMTASRLAKAELYLARAAFVLMLTVAVLNVGSRYLFATGILSIEAIASMGVNRSGFAAIARPCPSRALIAMICSSTCCPHPCSGRCRS